MSNIPFSIPSIGPVPLPLTEEQVIDYLAILAKKPRNKSKDLVIDQHEPDHFIDIAALERDIEAGKLSYKVRSFPVNGAQWKLKVANGQISQGDGGGIDLMYAASMPKAQANKLLIFICFPHGLSMVDGSHRIARAMIDGRQTLQGAVLDYADIRPYRIPEAEAEGRV